MKIIPDNLQSSEVIHFLEEHIVEMKSVSPPESKHALDLEGLRNPKLSFWSVWDDDEILVACGALLTLSKTHGEIKSMRSKKSVRGKGIASKLLEFILNEARVLGLKQVSLETGSMPFFAPARSLYRKFGFVECEPFADYKIDPNSVFMTKHL